MLRKNAVPDQNPKNFLKTTVNEMGCCDESERNCEHTASYVQANSVSALVIEEGGASVTLPLAIAANAPAAVAKAAIDLALKNAGYYEDSEGATGVKVIDSGANLDITITGDLKVLSITASGGPAVFIAKCTRKSLCSFAIEGFAGGPAPILKINGGAQTLAAITVGTTTAASVKSAFEAAFLAKGFVTVATVVAAPTNYNISLSNIPAQTTVTLLGASGVVMYFEASNCAAIYTA
ncbi:MAG: hypothetical protein ACRCVX_14195 [Shewanella sp.]